MTIGIHISNDLFTRYQENFNLSCIIRLAALQPTHSFILLADNQQQITINDPNCIIIRFPLANNRIQKYFQKYYKLPHALKKKRADLFIPAANNICSVCDLKQIVVIQNSPHLFIKKKWNAKKLSTALVTSPASVNGLEHHFNLVIKSVHGMHPDFKPLNINEKIGVRKKFTDDIEYFITETEEGRASDLRLILKAFSIFKKWQRSSLKLLVIFSGNELSNPIPDFNLYKYRNDVVFIYHNKTEQPERAALYAAAYAGILTNHLHVIAAMKCHVPTVVIGEISDIYGDAALYSPRDEKAIADRITQIYKNETLRNSLVTESCVLSGEYTWENAAEQLWYAIENTIR